MFFDRKSLNHFDQSKRTGFVLWVVPSTQIYRQTLAALRNREHPYRQVLDRASGGRTLILEKEDYFTPTQVEENLVIMLLMLPSANRAKDQREALRIFQDRSGFELFFPAEDDRSAQLALLQQYPNLDQYGDENQAAGVVLKTSLGNTLRLIQPIMIIDEGHKSYTELARNTIKTFNPTFVLELSATPRAEANVLVTITGMDLNREEMIKLDLNVHWLASQDWKDTLRASYQKIQQLDGVAQEYRARGGKYIRPICLVQVERTGQYTDRHIHVDDAKKFLIENCHVSEEQIAIKSATNDGLEDVDLLSEDCPIQFILTKQALQEGWDCPFAYVLAILSGSTSRTALTQLVGRMLRQPYVQKTGIKSLDESYVVCFRASTGNLIQYIQEGFETEGLSDLRNRIRETDGTDDQGYEQIRYRPELREFEGKIYLPRFVIQEDAGFRPVSYEMDILRRIDWPQVDLRGIFEVTLSDLEEDDIRMGFNLSDDRFRPLVQTYAEHEETTVPIDPVFMTRQLLDVVPNPWVAYDFVEKTIASFRERYEDRKIGANLVAIVNRLKHVLDKEKSRLAQRVFLNLIESGKLIFFVQAIRDFAVPSSIPVKRSTTAPRRLAHEDNQPVQMSLFEYEPEEEFNEYERSVALYLDKQKELLWWHRNLVGGNAFEIQGWEPHAIYPDFITAREGYTEVIVIETKGAHLRGNEDTEYKRSVLELCSNLGYRTDWEALGEEFKYHRVRFQMVYEDEWEAGINSLFASEKEERE
ncbi:restriction endonuclease subunit R [Nitrospirales bacterium NOB]|nr:restriction endonuclease subunit R [Nitrospirales bacterium NOB]